jgi:hypothetical protein
VVIIEGNNNSFPMMVGKETGKETGRKRNGDVSSCLWRKKLGRNKRGEINGEK